jgi:hypothetical protein
MVQPAFSAHVFGAELRRDGVAGQEKLAKLVDRTCRGCAAGLASENRDPPSNKTPSSPPRPLAVAEPNSLL